MTIGPGISEPYSIKTNQSTEGLSATGILSTQPEFFKLLQGLGSFTVDLLVVHALL